MITSLTRRAARRVAAAALAAATLACGDATEPPNDDVATLTAVGLSVVPGQVGTTLAAPLTVVARSQAGTPVAGVEVAWTVASGGATLVDVVERTDAAGNATARVRLPAVAGSAEIRATAAGLTPVVFTIVGQEAPTEITVAAEVPVARSYGLHDTFVRDGIAFASAWDTGLILYDVGNGMRGGTPAAPVEISRIVTSAQGSTSGPNVHNAWWFHNPVTGEKRYVFVGQEGPGGVGTRRASGDIHVVDVSDMTQPQEVAFFHVENAGVHNFWMDEQAQILYAAYYNGGVLALDVSGTLSGDLASRAISRIQPGGTSATFTWGVMLANGSLYASDMWSGLHQIRSQNGQLTRVAGGAVPDRWTSDLWIHGGWAYTGTWGGNARSGNNGDALKIWQLAADGAPTLVDSLIYPDVATTSDVEVSADGKYLLVTAEGFTGGGLYLYSLADPRRPQILGSVAVAAGLHTGTFATIGGRRYVFGARNPGLAAPAMMIYDVSAVAP